MMHQHSPLVSILTSCYNGSRHIEQYSACLLSQTYSPIECIIVNDGSTDDSGMKLEALAKKAIAAGISALVIHQENKGLAAGISAALSHSKGEYIICWDIDDWFSLNNVSVLAGLLIDNPNCGAAIANGYYAKADGSTSACVTFAQRSPLSRKENLFQALLDGKAWNWAGSYAVKAQCVEEIYGKRQIPIPRLWKNCQNLQLLMPAAYLGGVYSNKPIMKYINHSDSLTHMDNAYTTTIRKINAFEDIRLQILEIMNNKIKRGTLSQYKETVETSFTKRRLIEAYIARQEKDFLKAYLVLKKNKALDAESKLLNSIITKDCEFMIFLRKIIFHAHRFLKWE